MSQIRGLPVQRNVPTLIQGAISNTGPYAAGQAAAIGSVFPGYARVNVTQLQFGGTVQFSPLRGLYDVSLTAEADFQWVPGLPGTDQERLGRYGSFGTAEYNGACPQTGGVNVCNVAGFVTSFAWGYRVSAQASLPQRGSVTLVPVLFLGQDVQGYSADSQIVQGRLTGGAALRAIYLQRFYAQIGATWFRRNTEFDPLRDRGAYTLAAGVTF